MGMGVEVKEREVPDLGSSVWRRHALSILHTTRQTMVDPTTSTVITIVGKREGWRRPLIPYPQSFEVPILILSLLPSRSSL